MVQNTDLKRTSALFRLVAAIGVGIIIVGARFLAEPVAAAARFGVPADGTPDDGLLVGERNA